MSVPTTVAVPLAVAQAIDAALDASGLFMATHGRTVDAETIARTRRELRLALGWPPAETSSIIRIDLRVSL